MKTFQNLIFQYILVVLWKEIPLHYVHTLGEKIEGSQEIMKGLYWGGDFEVVKKMVENNKVDNSNIRFFAGYSGWNENQLIAEVS